MTQTFPFFSSGLRLDAHLHLPNDGELGPPYPTIVPVSGFQGLKSIHPERFARALTPLGYAVLTFDYRGFGDSEGERGRLAPQEWAADVHAAMDRLTTADEIDPERIGLLGWGLGGGVVVATAADDSRACAIAVINGIGDGTRATRSTHTPNSWQKLLDRVRTDRGHRATLGRSEVTAPWDIVRLDLDSATDHFVETELYKAPGFGKGVTLESADWLLRFRPEQSAHRISPRPLLIIHGQENKLHPPEEAQSLYDHAAEPKELIFLEEQGHTDWMFDGHPVFRSLVQRLDTFFVTAFASGEESHNANASGVGLTC